MIIDLILDRKDGAKYDPKTFYNDVMEYSAIFNRIGDDITRAMDHGTEDDARAAICDYIVKNGYNPEICNYVNSVKWIGVWRIVSTKRVHDSDGSITDYTWYTNCDNNIFMFGDLETTEPDEEYADWQEENWDIAREWFDNYNGFSDFECGVANDE